MTCEEIKVNAGAIVILNGSGDLAFRSECKKMLNNNEVLEIVKLTRGGLAYLKTGNDFICVPPKNVDFYSERY